MGGILASEPVRIREPICFGGDFELDPRLRQLRRAGRIVRLEPTPMQILLLLIERPGQLVTREEIIQAVWGQNVFVDTDNSINGAIRKIRLVLKDDTEQPRFVQTVPGKGYRFIGDIAEHAPEPIARAPEIKAVPNVGPELPVEGSVPPKRKLPAAVIACALLVAALGTYFVWSRFVRHSNGAGQKMMLAVLPFKNLTGDVGQDYFSDGLTEEMIAQLGGLEPNRLGVIARTSVMHYKDSTQPLVQIAKELGVQYVLEGSVRRDAGRVRITAQLIQVKDQTHLWAQQYDREVNDLLDVQGEIALQIADEIQLTLEGPKQANAARTGFARPAKFEAYDLYLKGRYFWNKRTVEGLHQAIQSFQAAIAEDPNYARAYAGIADSYALLGGYTALPQKEFTTKAREAALKALQLDPNLPEAHASLAVIAQNYDWDWKTAEEEYRRAIQLDPNYATAHHWYAEFLSYHGRFDEAFAEIERARQLDPLSLIIASDKGSILYYARRYDDSIAQFKSVLEMEPKFPRGRLIVAPYIEKGRYSEALAVMEKWGPSEDDAWDLMMHAYVYHRAGSQVKALGALKKLERLTQARELDAAPLLSAYVVMEDKAKSYEWLDKAFAEHSNAVSSLKVNPLYDPLRGDPQFQQYLKRAGFTQ